MADTPADPNTGAAGTELRTLQSLRALGHDVDAIWSDELGRRIAHGNRHLLLELPRAYKRAAVEAARRRAYDVMHVNQPHGYAAARAMRRVSPRTVFVHRSHGFEMNLEETLQPWRAKFGNDNRGILRRVASYALAALLARHGRAIAREADGHIVSSSLDATFLRERLGVAAGRIAVIAQAAPESFLRLPASPLDARRLRRVLFVGQLTFSKAPMIVGAAMRALAERHADLQFTWVCSRAHHDEVRGLAPANIELLDWMPAARLIEVYDAHGLFLFPSFFEGFGKVFLEAMSRGLCVIASNVGGARDVIENGVSGLLVPPGDAAAIASAAESLLADPSRAAAMATEAARVSRTYTWDRVARETATFYEVIRTQVAAQGSVRRSG